MAAELNIVMVLLKFNSVGSFLSFVEIPNHASHKTRKHKQHLNDKQRIENKTICDVDTSVQSL